MKRFLALLLLTCLLLCGCETDAPATEPVTESVQVQTQPVTTPVEKATTPAEQTTTEEVAETTQPKSEKVTVYLVEESFLFDSGRTTYHYDENYNIDSYTVYTMENEVRYTAYFENKDSNGMAGSFREQWPESSTGYILTHFADGKLKEIQLDDGSLTGTQYEYDQKGDITEKRDYYDGILHSIVYFEYDGETLSAVYGEDAEGNKVFDCRIENGLIVEQRFSDYTMFYKYDANNNLMESSILYEGETLPSEQYTYKAVEVDAERAYYLLEQQKFLVSIY